MAIETKMAQPQNDPTRITPNRRRWRFPRTNPHPDILAIIAIVILVCDFINHGYDLTSKKEISQWRALGLIGVYGLLVWIIWRLSQGAVAWYNAHPLVRRGYHQHHYSGKARADHDGEVYYHEHRFAFPYHCYLYRRTHN